MSNSMTTTKQYLLDLLDSLQPYETITITADKEGKPDRFLVQRSQKIMVSEIKIEPVR